MGLKKIAFELIVEEEGIESEPYRILREIRDAFHEETRDARIALAWRKGFKPDPEGHLVLGKCVKASDLQRELVDLDFVILLNKEVWMDEQFTVEMKKALVDHELCHAARACNADGDPAFDEKLRPVWRVKRHDLEEFFDIAKRHGCWKRDLQIFAEAIVKKKNPIFPQMEADSGQDVGKFLEPVNNSIANIEAFFGPGTVDARTSTVEINGKEYMMGVDTASGEDETVEAAIDPEAIFSSSDPEAAVDATRPEYDAAWDGTPAEEPVKRGRGRPRKETATAVMDEEESF